MKTQNVGIVLAGTASLASSVLSPLSIDVTHAESRDQIDQMNRDAQSVVERFHKNGGGTALAQKVSEAKQVPHLKVIQDKTKVIHSSVQAINNYDSSARMKIKKQLANLQEAENKQKQYNADYQKAVQVRNEALKRNKDAQAQLDNLKQERTQLEKELAEAQKNGVKLVHDQDTNKVVSTSDAKSEAQKVSQDYEKQKQDLSKAEAEYQQETAKADSAYQKAGIDANVANQKNTELAQTAEKASKVEGVTVVQDADENKPADPSNEVQVATDNTKDIQNQIDNINKQIEDQQAKLKTYNEQLNQYDKKRQDFINELKQEGLWQEGATDLSKLGQKLSIQSETQAKVSAQLLQNVGTINGNGLTFTDTNAIKGDFLHLSYSNLKNSSYNGKAINEITIDFSDKKTSGAINSSLTWGNDPIYGWWYNGYSGVTATIKLFDVNGKQISITNDAPAYISAGSLNHDLGGKVETVRLYSNGKGIKIPESSVNVHDGNILYSDKANWIGDSGKEWGERYVQISPNSMSMAKNIWGNEIATKYQHWDGSSSDTPERIFGCGLYQVDGNEIKLRSYIDNDADGLNQSAWFTWSTTVPQTSFDAKGPQKPELTIHWHKSNVALKPKNEVAPKEVHYHFTNLSLNPEKVPDLPPLKQSEVHYHNVDLVLDPHPLPDKTKQITITDTSKKTKEGTQTYHFVDKNTGKVLTTSKVGGEVGKNVSVFLKVPAGYRLVVGQKIPTSANIKDKDTPINILVEKDNNKKPATQTYEFVDKNGNKIVGTAKVNGNVGDKVPVSLKVPKGYHLVPGQKLPTLADLKATDKPIKIMVEKDGNGADNGSADSGLNGKKKNTPNKGNNVNGGNGVASLPQTGNSKSTAGVLAGTALVATMASLGIAYNKKKRNA